KMQYEQFVNKETKVLVTTDAIGMGVNLPIQRIVFMSIRKFDGEEVRELTSQEIKQVGGRAGRIGIYDVGYVAAVGGNSHIIKEKIEREDAPIERAVIGPSDAILSIKSLPLNEKLALWSTRKEKVEFSKPYLNNTQIIVTLADSTINSKADLAGKKVGAQNQSTAVDAVEADGDIMSTFDGGNLVTFEDNNQALMDLEAKRLDAIVVDEILARYYIKARGEEKYKILTENFGDEQYGVGIRKGDTKFVEAFNKALSEVVGDGQAAEISKKWFGEDIVVK
ncbi:MAG: transporter substrate-binding domain-containing protein, partial [Clostridium sp.]|nr:transporter substrate-binding domain-containing protein [Clostridium sp.]